MYKNKKEKEKGDKKENKKGDDEEKEPPLPFPYLSGFVGWGEMYKPSKRLIIHQRRSSREIQKEVGDQVIQKREELNTIVNLDQQEDKRYFSSPPPLTPLPLTPL